MSCYSPDTRWLLSCGRELKPGHVLNRVGVRIRGHNQERVSTRLVQRRKVDTVDSRRPLKRDMGYQTCGSREWYGGDVRDEGKSVRRSQPTWIEEVPKSSDNKVFRLPDNPVAGRKGSYLHDYSTRESSQN